MFRVFILFVFCLNFSFGNSIEIKKGWNLTTLPESSFINYPKANIIWEYSDKNWKVYSNLGMESIPLEEINITSSSKGYWVHSDNDFNISIDSASSELNIDNFKDGWHLLGTTSKIFDFDSMKKDLRTIWIYKDDKWYAKGFNEHISKKLIENQINSFGSIPEYSGFWLNIKKNTKPISNGIEVLNSNVNFAEPVEFSIYAIDKENDKLSYFWVFNDGKTSTEQNPHHIYYDSGNYYVTVTVTDEKGDSETYSKWITVYNSFNLNNEVKDCSIENQNRYIYNLLKDIYYWHDTIEEVDTDSYSSPEELLDDIMNINDKWSYIKKTKSYSNYKNYGEYEAYGFKTGRDSNFNIWIVYVEPGSPAENAGIKRGDKIISAGGYSNYEIINNSLWGEFKKDSNEFVIERYNGSTYKTDLSKSLFIIDTVPIKDIFYADSEKVGYLFFRTFIYPAYEKLDSAFEYFKKNNITKLILDLRYNGGGSMAVGNYLSSMINNENIGSDSARLIYNDKHQELNHNYQFKDFNNSLSLDSLYVITSSRTCSASETLINALRPHIDVYTIGSTTCGKPYGMNGWKFCDKTILPITFNVKNAQDETFSSDGIEPLCYAPDYINYELGDTNEKRIEAALNHIKSGNCSSNLYKSIERDEELKDIPLKGLSKEFGSL